MSLYTLSLEFATALDKIMDSDLPEDCIADTIEGMSMEVVTKAQNVTAYMLNLSAEAEMIKAAEKKMAERRKAIENRAEKFREYLKSSMEMTGITEIKANDGSFCAKLLIDRDEVVVINDDLLLPPEFINVVTTTAPDKAAIKKALKAGIEVPGAVIEKRNRLEVK